MQIRTAFKGVIQPLGNLIRKSIDVSQREYLTTCFPTIAGLIYPSGILPAFGLVLYRQLYIHPPNNEGPTNARIINGTSTER